MRRTGSELGSATLTSSFEEDLSLRPRTSSSSESFAFIPNVTSEPFQTPRPSPAPRRTVSDFQVMQSMSKFPFEKYTTRYWEERQGVGPSISDEAISSGFLSPNASTASKKIYGDGLRPPVKCMDSRLGFIAVLITAALLCVLALVAVSINPNGDAPHADLASVRAAGETGASVSEAPAPKQDGAQVDAEIPIASIGTGMPRRIAHRADRGYQLAAINDTTEEDSTTPTF